MKKITYSAILAAVLAVAGSSVQAAQLLNEPFDQYANGTTLTSTGNWSAFSGAGTTPLTANNGTVTATNVASGTSGEDDNNKFAATPVTTGMLYLSTLITVPTGTTVTSATGDYFFSLYSTATSGGGYGVRVYLAQGSAAGTVAFGLTTAAANATTNPVNKTADLTLGTEYKLVLRYDVAAKTATMGLFAVGTVPTSDSQLTITSGTAGAATGIDSVAIRQGSGSAFTNVIDGTQVGTTLSDVASITTGASPYFNAAVPEPSTWAALVSGLGLLALAARRRLTA